jgi:putative spermidine/putrescine transport system permease protein
MTTVDKSEPRPGLLRISRRMRTFNRAVLLLLPSVAIFLIFFLLPVLTLLALAFNEQGGPLRLQPNFTLANMIHFASQSVYVNALFRSVWLGVLTALMAVLMGYPVAYVMAKTQTAGRSTMFMILILLPLQIDMVIRAYGLIVLFGDSGIINGFLLNTGLIRQPLPLSFNEFAVIVALLQLALPLMVLSLIGVLRGINPSLEEAARNLGAGRWRAFFSVVWPLSLPGVLAGSLLVFSVSISSYLVPQLMGGGLVQVLPTLIYQQIARVGNWQMGAAIASVLFVASLSIVYFYHRVTQRYLGGIV